MRGTNYISDYDIGDTVKNAPFKKEEDLFFSAKISALTILHNACIASTILFSSMMNKTCTSSVLLARYFVLQFLCYQILYLKLMKYWGNFLLKIRPV